MDLADNLCPGIRLRVLRGDLKAPDILFEHLAKAAPEEYGTILEQIKHPQPKARPATKQPQLPERPPSNHSAAKLPYAEPHFEEMDCVASDSCSAYAQLNVAATKMQEAWTFIFEQTPSLRTDPEHRKAVQAILEKHLNFLNTLVCNLELSEADKTRSA